MPRSLLGIEPLNPRQIMDFLKLSKTMNPARPRNTLRGRRVALLFYENSTRTRTSFEIAAKSLGATTVVIHASSTSVEKGESLKDTGLTLRSIVDAIVVRHPSSGAPNLLDRVLGIPIINAGDGMHEHPSQGLLDAFTILQHKKTLKGLKIVTIGDIFHSRVARSDAHLFTKLGAQVVFCGPEVLLPKTAASLAPGIKIERDMDEAIRDADVVMMLRVQQERLAGLQIVIDEYVRRYQLTAQRLNAAKKDAIVMHPGPMIRGMEMTDDVADCGQSVVLEQVLNGVKVRMAILETLLGRRK
ncbi:MAG TPA: aspartate carbamoyltransferase catalytic subunit [Candidatus Acidoferrales bacterium]|nr:aspartate carbamoyltransferase catalytic subunit [Candidatus Acidoferrales bacterium]